MPKMHKFVRDILKNNDVDPREACWDCHGTWVIYHKYLERIADRNGITFDTPQILACDLDKKAAAICVTGHLGDRSAWSFGEATTDNNKNPYPLAMAEKRAKDRVILKLAGLSGHIYSEEEADVFKESRPPLPPEPEPVMAAAPEPAAPPAPPLPEKAGSHLSLDDRKGMIVTFFEGSPGKHARRKILDATGLTRPQVSPALKALADEGTLIQTGAKSGTRYHLASDDSVASVPPVPTTPEPPEEKPRGLHGEELDDANQAFRTSIGSPPPPKPPEPVTSGEVTSDDLAQFTNSLLSKGANFRDIRNWFFQMTGHESGRDALQAGALTEETLKKIDDLAECRPG